MEPPEGLGGAGSADGAGVRERWSHSPCMCYAYRVATPRVDNHMGWSWAVTVACDLAQKGGALGRPLEPPEGSVGCGVPHMPTGDHATETH